MSINGSEYMQEWGKKIPVNDFSHITQTNDLSRDGLGAHITWNVPGENWCVHDRFDANGNFGGSSFAPRSLPRS